MKVEELLGYLDNYLQPIDLNDLQETVLQLSWEGKTYVEIANETHHDPDYIKRVGSSLWKLLSEALGEKVNKKNIHVVIRRQARNHCKHERKQIKINLLEPQSISLASNKSRLIERNKAIALHQDWGEKIDVSMFYGRAKEIATLEQWIVNDRCRLICLLGLAGIGKTALAVKLAKQIAGEFEYLIWRSLRNAPPFPAFLKEIMIFLSNQPDITLTETIDGQISQLMTYLRQHRCLLILDNAESILQSGQLGGKYLPNYENYGQLLRRIQDEQHQSCVLITSCEKPTGLTIREGKNLVVRSLLLDGLSLTEAYKILKVQGLTNSKDQFKQLIEYYGGNPLALKTVSATIHSLFASDLTAFLNQGTVIFGEIWQMLDRQFERLSSLERQIMYSLTGNYHCMTLTQLYQDLTPTTSYRELIEALDSLSWRSLIKINHTDFSLPSIVKKYMIERISTKSLITEEVFLPIFST